MFVENKKIKEMMPGMANLDRQIEYTFNLDHLPVATYGFQLSIFMKHLFTFKYTI